MAIDINKVRVLKHFGQSYYPVAHAESTIYKNETNNKKTVSEALDTLVSNVSTINSGLSNRYTKTEVNNLLNLYISRIHLFEYVNVDGYKANLPQASESTMYKIYLVKSSNLLTANVKDEFITLKTPIPIHSGNVQYFGPRYGAGKPTAEMINEGDILIYSDNPLLDSDSYDIKENGNLEGYSALAGYIIVDTAHNKYYKMNNNGTAWVEELGQPTYTYSWEQIGSTAIDVSNKINTVTGADNYIPKFNSSGQLVSSGVTSENISDAVSKKHSHSNITLSTSALNYDGSHTIQLPANDPYSTARTPSSHTHGNISNSGTLTDTASVPNSGDKIVIRDTNNSIKTSTIDATYVNYTINKRPYYINSEDIDGLIFSDIEDAYNAGRQLIFIYDLYGGIYRSVYFPLTVTNVNTNLLNEQRYFIFGGAYTDKEGYGSDDQSSSEILRFELWEGDNDSVILHDYSDDFELVINKTLSISSSSTRGLYPSAKAVYDYVDTLSASISDIQSIFTA